MKNLFNVFRKRRTCSAGEQIVWDLTKHNEKTILKEILQDLGKAMLAILVLLIMYKIGVKVEVIEPVPQTISTNTNINTNTSASTLSNTDRDIMYAVVYTESGALTNEFEWQLILECFIYKKYKYMKQGSFKRYTDRYPGHFQGLYNISRYHTAKAITDGKEVAKTKTWVGNAHRLKQIRRVVNDRLDRGTARPIEYYHHQLTKKIKFADGSTKLLNTKHIDYVQDLASKGKYTRLKSSNIKLIHDFFECNNPINGYYKYRESLRTI